MLLKVHSVIPFQILSNFLRYYLDSLTVQKTLQNNKNQNKQTNPKTVILDFSSLVTSSLTLSSIFIARVLEKAAHFDGLHYFHLPFLFNPSQYFFHLLFCLLVTICF